MNQAQTAASRIRGPRRGEGKQFALVAATTKVIKLPTTPAWQGWIKVLIYGNSGYIQTAADATISITPGQADTVPADTSVVPTISNATARYMPAEFELEFERGDDITHLGFYAATSAGSIQIWPGDGGSTDSSKVRT